MNKDSVCSKNKFLIRFEIGVLWEAELKPSHLFMEKPAMLASQAFLFMSLRGWHSSVRTNLLSISTHSLTGDCFAARNDIQLLWCRTDKRQGIQRIFIFGMNR